MTADHIIGIDCRELEGKPTGVGAYIKGILQELVLPSRTRLQLYFRTSVPENLSNLEAEKIVLSSQASNLAWQQWILCRELSRRNVALFFSPANSLPWRFAGIQTMTLHDLSYFRYPFWFRAKERISRQLNTTISVRSADRIYADSDFIKTEIAQHFKIPNDRILVSACGVVSRHEIDFTTRNKLKEEKGLAERNVILYAGSVFNRRRLPVLIGAMAHLDAAYILIIIGENRTFPHIDLKLEAQKLGVADRVQILEYAADDFLQNYYRIADVFVYLSEYEGFGIPPLEAMSHDLPVILSDNAPLNSIYREAALFSSSMTPTAVADAIRKVLTDDFERARMIEAGKQLVSRYTWRETARIISSDWERLLESRS